MTVEAVNFISDLNPALPTGADSKAEGDDHVRNIKKGIKASFPNIAGAMNLTHTALNALPDSVAAKGAINGQTWTGTHNFPDTTYGVTAPFGSSGTRYATLDYVNNVTTNAALPGQSSNSGKVLATNGTSAKWVNAIPTIHVYETSTTWVADVPRIKLTIIGGGGSSAASGTTNAYTGGAAGGTAIKVLDVIIGQTYTITIGAGGAAVSAAEGGSALGNAGGTSSFSGPGITTVSATGGAGGVIVGSASGPGGIGIGGDINLRGGRSNKPTTNDGYSIGGDSFLGKGAPWGEAGDAWGAGAGGNNGTFTGGQTGKAGYKGVVIIEKLVVGA